ncbi:hypothetical protein QYE76_054022 [Lolium multiflorum]|uniref:CCHC-type domain-containing protein n=1 Tax=Lolium multiflorum TaxID=4521 RepID=A0AAD8SWW3_LOLMU|nr:hypothetical protein QYE76_054022 [Lolium multiflorum]
MLQLLQTLLADREDERAERQANIAALQQIANQGHGNHDHPGSKLKNFQNTNPPVFSKTEEPLDADDWLQTMENNLEVAGVDENEKVLFATHYLAGPARAWWTSARALNAGQMMTWADFKLKFSKYHVPPGLIKKMRDEFRELKQGRMSVVEYRDRFLTLSRYAPDETDTTEKRKERFLNGLHDEMQTVLVNIPFADLEALVDSAIQMEGKLHQANENRKRRMMNQNKTLLDTTCSGSFTSNKEEFKRDLLDRIKENAEDWENDKGKESGYADKPPFKPLPPKEGNEEKEKKKKKGTKKKKKKKKENKKKEVTAYPRVNEITLGNRKYVAPNDYYDNESEYDDLPIPFTHISDHDLDEHIAFDIENLFGTDYEINDDSIIHVPLNDDIESSKLGDVVLEDPVFETSTFSENDDITYSGLLERDIFDLFLPEFDKPWVIHLRETCCCSTNLCTWRPNTVYKNRSTRRHHSSGGFNPRNTKPQNQMSRPGFQNRSGGNPRPGGPHHNNNYVHHNSNFNRAPPRTPNHNHNNNNTNTAPRTGSNAIPVATKDKSTITCYECGVVGHFSNECPKRLAKLAGNTSAPAQQQRRVSTGKSSPPTTGTTAEVASTT